MKIVIQAVCNGFHTQFNRSGLQTKNEGQDSPT
jgi:hypothetical protein